MEGGRGGKGYREKYVGMYGVYSRFESVGLRDVLGVLSLGTRWDFPVGCVCFLGTAQTTTFQTV